MRGIFCIHLRPRSNVAQVRSGKKKAERCLRARLLSADVCWVWARGTSVEPGLFCRLEEIRRNEAERHLKWSKRESPCVPGDSLRGRRDGVQYLSRMRAHCLVLKPLAPPRMSLFRGPSAHKSSVSRWLIGNLSDILVLGQRALKINK